MSCCAICLEPKKKEIKLNCNHSFCKDCIKKYEKKGGLQCPCCRRPFTICNTMSLEDQILLLKLKFLRFHENDYDYDISYTYHLSDDDEVDVKRTITMRCSDDVKRNEVYI